MDSQPLDEPKPTREARQGIDDTPATPVEPEYVDARGPLEMLEDAAEEITKGWQRMRGTIGPF